jgi:hypothetical protein
MNAGWRATTMRYAVGVALVIMLSLVIYAVTIAGSSDTSSPSWIENAVLSRLQSFVISSLVTGLVLTVVLIITPKGRLARWAQKTAGQLAFYCLWAVGGIIVVLILYLLEDPAAGL